jgi:phage FluMu protein Com
MKSTHLTLLKFRCDKRDCEFEIYVNKNNNLLMHYNANMSALLEWPCPECKSGHLRYAPTNAKYEYHLVKKDRPDAQESLVDDADAP